MICAARRRFDLIYLILDKADEERDRRLARHLVSLFHEGVQPHRQPEVTCGTRSHAPS